MKPSRKTLSDGMTPLIAVVSLVMIVSISLRCYGLDISSYWIDEMVSVHFAKHPYWGSVFWDNNPPLYHTLLKIWVSIFGDDERATRALSVIFSALSTGVFCKIGYNLQKIKGALIFGLIQSVSFLSILYAQETRMYAMFEFFTSLNLLYFIHFLKTGKHIRAYIVSSVFMAFSHYLALIPLGIEGGLLMLYRRDFFLKNKVLIVGLLIPVFLQFISYLNFFQWDGLKWQKLKYTVDPWANLPVEVIKELSNRSILFGIAAVILIAVFIHRTIKIRKERPERIAILCLIFLPFFMMMFGTLLTQRSIFMARYYMYVLPPLLLLLGTALIDLEKNVTLKVGVFILLTIGTIISLPSIYRPYKEPWRDVVGIVKKYPNSLILTTRTATIGTPYFEELHMRVKKWNPESGEGLSMLAKEVNKTGSVWIVENFWGGFSYMPSLGQLLKKSFHVSELSVKTDYSIPIFVMLVQKKEENE